MLFFGFHMIFARTPEKEIFSNYLLSRRLMGIALLILSANYSVHLIYGIRLKDVNATILMNLSTYFICYWLFSSAMTTLLDNRYITRKRFSHHVRMWIVFSATAMAVVFFIDNVTVQSLVSGILALWLVAYGLTLSFRLLKTYRKAVRMFEETHSDDIESYIRWLSMELRTNRTYLSEYINTTYNKSFRDWITDLRIEYAKRLMSQKPQLKIQEIAELSGFLSTSHFNRTFREKEGCSPVKWGDK